MPNKMKPKKFSNSSFFFDDCPICRAMKKADQGGNSLSLTELKQVFKKANKNVGQNNLIPAKIKRNQ